jgi:hypothetical protein
MLAYRLVVGNVFRALADPTRRVILDEPRERDGQTLFELYVRLATKHGLGSPGRPRPSTSTSSRTPGSSAPAARAGTSSTTWDTAPLNVIVERRM